jgi:hypothetical protein
MVFDYDQFSVDECIGYCWLTLRRLTVSTLKDQPTIFWAEVLPFDDDSGVSLLYYNSLLKAIEFVILVRIW